MASPSNIQLQISRNGSAPQTGGIVAAYGDSCVLSLVDPTGVKKCLYEIYSYPSGFSVPVGWTADPAGPYYYLSATGGPAPAFSLPASTVWGDFLTRATANDGTRTGSDGKQVAAPDLIDERTALRILSSHSLPDVPYLGGRQFDPFRSWAGALQQWLRAMENGTFSGGAIGSLSAVLGVGNLSGANDIIMEDDQLVLLGQTNVAQSGLLRTRNNQGGIKWRNNANTADFGIDVDASDNFKVGTTGGGHPNLIQLVSETGVEFYVNDGDAPSRIAKFAASGHLGQLLFDADICTSGVSISATTPTGTAAGTALTLAGGAGHGTNQNGGDAAIKAGPKTGSGSDGSAGVQDSSGAWRIRLNDVQELSYNAASLHKFECGGLSVFLVQRFGNYTSIASDTSTSTDGMLVGPTTPTTASAGPDLALAAGGGGTGNQDGGDTFIQGGPKTGSGSDGIAGIKDTASAWRLQLDGSKNLTYDAVTTHTFKIGGTAKATLSSGSFALGALYQEFADTTAPSTPSTAHRIWSESGALKGKGSSGTITTIAPAEPHCPRCGKDAAHEWENPDQGWKLSLCMWCASAGIPLPECVIERTGT